LSLKVLNIITISNSNGALKRTKYGFTLSILLLRYRNNIWCNFKEKKKQCCRVAYKLDEIGTADDNDKLLIKTKKNCLLKVIIYVKIPLLSHLNQFDGVFTFFTLL